MSAISCLEIQLAVTIFTVVHVNFPNLSKRKDKRKLYKSVQIAWPYQFKVFTYPVSDTGNFTTHSSFSSIVGHSYRKYIIVVVILVVVVVVIVVAVVLT